MPERALLEAEYRIRPILRRRTLLEDAAVREQLRILRAARRDILAAMVDAGAFDRWRLSVLLGVIDREIAQGLAAAQLATAQVIERGFGLGTEFATAAIGVQPGLVGVSRELFRAVVEVTTDQVRDVWGELGSKLKMLVRRAALGVTDPYRAMRALSKIIRDPKTFGRAFWRAETIIRTEVNRTFGLASQSELERGAKAGVKLRKWWLTAGDERVRDSHRQAGEDYPEAAAIPWDGFFEVGDDRLLHPLDPNGSPEETIRCRCVAVPKVMD